MRFELITQRTAEDVSRLYVEARVAGLEITHYKSLDCYTFDGAPVPGTRLGVFRLVGALCFQKEERRWEVRARTDAGAVDLSTLITCGLGMVEKYGRTPGHFTRTRGFKHMVRKNGKRVAWIGVCYQLNAEDLLGTVSTAEPLDTFEDQLRVILTSADS
ncbi:hypothetical protein [Nocardioides sp. AE5]|uniref:hypothetical protein n=1 Tax=Nocardioides sp. AE5 TaxID=2962573 RepID=UPI00288100D6|nr:hypothetical protein [Nocardioides sp. AE5]MDT0201357.1 hypothetical protein [Nocardioides sp. AE5]